MKNYLDWLEKVGATTKQEILAKTQSEPNITIQFEFLQIKDKETSMYPLNTRFKASWRVDSKNPDGVLVFADCEIIEVLPMSAQKKHNLTKGAEQRFNVDANGSVEQLGLKRKDIEMNPFKKYPRNAPCFCGTGKKFKKCHEQILTHWVLKKDYATLKTYFDSVIEALGIYGTEEFNRLAKTNFSTTATREVVREPEVQHQV